MSYPDGCTQAMHDAAHREPSADAVNAAEQILEERAHKSLLDCDEHFAEFVTNYMDGKDVARIISLAVKHRRGDPTDWQAFWSAVGTMQTDYKDHYMFLSQAELDQLTEEY